MIPKPDRELTRLKAIWWSGVALSVRSTPIAVAAEHAATRWIGQIDQRVRVVERVAAPRGLHRDAPGGLDLELPVEPVVVGRVGPVEARVRDGHRRRERPEGELDVHRRGGDARPIAVTEKVVLPLAEVSPVSVPAAQIRHSGVPVAPTFRQNRVVPCGLFATSLAVTDPGPSVRNVKVRALPAGSDRASSLTPLNVTRFWAAVGWFVGLALGPVEADALGSTDPLGSTDAPGDSDDRALAEGDPSPNDGGFEALVGPRGRS